MTLQAMLHQVLDPERGRIPPTPSDDTHHTCRRRHLDDETSVTLTPADAETTQMMCQNGIPSRSSSGDSTLAAGVVSEDEDQKVGAKGVGGCERVVVVQQQEPMADPIIRQLLATRTKMTDVDEEFEKERQRRMYNMLRHSHHYKRMQVQTANDKWESELEQATLETREELGSGNRDASCHATHNFRDPAEALAGAANSGKFAVHSAPTTCNDLRGLSRAPDADDCECTDNEDNDDDNDDEDDNILAPEMLPSVGDPARRRVSFSSNIQVFRDARAAAAAAMSVSSAGSMSSSYGSSMNSMSPSSSSHSVSTSASSAASSNSELVVRSVRNAGASEDDGDEREGGWQKRQEQSAAQDARHLSLHHHHQTDPEPCPDQWRQELVEESSSPVPSQSFPRNKNLKRIALAVNRLFNNPGSAITDS